VQRLLNFLGDLDVEEYDDSEVVEAYDVAERALTTLSQAINEYAGGLREQLDELREQLNEMDE
jgi:hypothetical protein